MRPGATVIAVAALMLVNVAFRSGNVSFRLRPNMDGRMLLMMGAVFAGLLAGGLLFPRLAARARTMATGAWLLLPLAAVLPGAEQYITNEPLRVVANFGMGMMVGPAYFLFFTRVPVGKRGLWFGLAEAVGVLTWTVLTRLAEAAPVTAAPPHHPLLPHVYAVHAAAIALATAVCLYAFTVRPGRTADGGDPGDASWGRSAATGSGRRAVVVSLLCVGFAVFFLAGILDARLTPIAFASRSPSPGPVTVGLVMAASAVAAGWLLDRWAGQFARRFMAGCCWLFLIAPSLAALGDNPVLRGVLQMAGTAGQYGFYVVCSVTLAAWAANAFEATALPCLFPFMRIGTVLGVRMWNRFGVTDEGVTVFAATAVAALIFLMMRRALAADGGTADGAEAAPSRAVAVADPDSFLAGAALTAREEEAARLLLQGMTTRDVSIALGISERAVTKHATAIFRKFGVANRRALYALYLSALSEKAEKAPKNPPEA